MAGLAVVDTITGPDLYTELLPRCQRFYDGVNEIFGRRRFPGRVKGVGARCAFLFGRAAENPQLVNYRDFAENDWDLALRFYGGALEHGMYMHSAHHHGISAMHTDADVDLILDRVDALVSDLLREGVDPLRSLRGVPRFF